MPGRAIGWTSTPAPGIAVGDRVVRGARRRPGRRGRPGRRRARSCAPASRPSSAPRAGRVARPRRPLRRRCRHRSVAAVRDADAGEQVGGVAAGSSHAAVRVCGERPHGDRPGGRGVHVGRSRCGPGRTASPGAVGGGVSDCADRGLGEGIRRQRVDHVGRVGERAVGVGADEHRRRRCVRAPPARAARRIAEATEGGSLTEVAAWMTTAASTSPEASSARMVFSYASASAAAPRSIGLRAEARPGAAARRASWVAGESSGTSRPASAAGVGGEDAGSAGVADDAEAGRPGTGCPDSSCTTSSSSSVPRTWITPACGQQRVHRHVRGRGRGGVRGAGRGRRRRCGRPSARRSACARRCGRACRRNFSGLPNDSR